MLCRLDSSSQLGEQAGPGRDCMAALRLQERACSIPLKDSQDLDFPEGEDEDVLADKRPPDGSPCVDANPSAYALHARQQAPKDCGLAMTDLSCVVRQCVAALPPAFRTDFFSFGERAARQTGSRVSLSTLCSGTDGCVDALKACPLSTS